MDRRLGLRERLKYERECGAPRWFLVSAEEAANLAGIRRYLVWKLWRAGLIEAAAIRRRDEQILFDLRSIRRVLEEVSRKRSGKGSGKGKRRGKGGREPCPICGYDGW